MYVCIVAAWHDIFVTTIIRDRKKIRRRQKNVSKKSVKEDKKIHREGAIKLIQSSGTAESPEI